MRPSDDQPVQRLKRGVRGARVAVRRWTAGRRMLPHFLVLGAQKAGTTSFYHGLCHHRQIAAALCKEPHYFDDHYHRGLAWYRAHFPHRKANRITGEASPYYLYHPHVPGRVREVLPDARLLVLLRDPAARAWSHYQHECRHGYESLSFEAAIDAEEARLATGEDFHQRHHSYLARGRYAEQLARWFALFPREQFLIMRSEDYFADPARGEVRVHAFLGVKPATITGRQRLNANPIQQPIPNAMQEKLRAYFQPHEEQLATLL